MNKSLSPHKLSAASMARAIRRGEVTSEEIVRGSLEHAARSERVLRAWHALDADTALTQAARRDLEHRKGLLHGVPIAVKDLSDTADYDTSYGSPAYRGNRPAVDAACVAALRAAGAVILGKTATVEFGASRPCETTNPHNPNHTPGGSSAGSAAVVADCQVPLAIGTQTGGSIIRPASFCGVVGFKPTYGILSPGGTKSYAWSLDTVGGFANSVSDVSLLFDALRGAEKVTEISAGDQVPRVGIFLGPFKDVASSQAIARLIEVASICERNGATLCDIPAPTAFTYSLDWQRTISRYEMARSLLPEMLAFNESTLGSDLYGEIQASRLVSEGDYLRAKQGGFHLNEDLAQLFSDIDILLTLSVPGEAPLGLHSTGDATFCLSWSLVGMPTVNLPAGPGAGQLPLGIQLVGKRHHDETLLRFAAWVEHVINKVRKN
ncbi:amidase [Rhizobium leguminosarum]|uniref:amidase n=1 Tax=Rhizobium leguminosarum TaxID=384 RepID=UPI001C9891EE|nr:amidase [Rhizobium leguminosarum]MBY5502441.1 amidase [Rhizobium leguminosarum]